MADIAREFAAASSAVERPAVALLNHQYAAFVLAVFRLAFGAGAETVPAETFRQQVDVYLDELAGEGLERGESLPREDARAVCSAWVRGEWLVRSAGADESEVYSLSSHARDALEYVTNVSGTHPLFSESRIQAILDAARRCALLASPDREARIARLDTEIERLTAERRRLAEADVLEPASDEAMTEAYLTARSAIGPLGAELSRLSESIDALNREVIADFRAERNAAGEVVGDYLERSRNLMSGSAGGRAFDGAVQMLRDARVLDELRADLEATLAHPFAARLAAAERGSFRRTPQAITDGVVRVLAHVRRTTATLRTRILRHDPARDRELDVALRAARAAASAWFPTTGPRTRVEVPLGAPALAVSTFPDQFYDPAGADAPPRPLADPTRDQAGGGTVLTLEDLRNLGGPRGRELAAHLEAAVRDAGDDGLTVAELFRTGGDALQRPVELLGYLQLAADHGLLQDASGHETVTATRPDGTRRSFTVPHIVFRRTATPADRQEATQP